MISLLKWIVVCIACILSSNNANAMDLVKEGYAWTKNNEYTTISTVTNWEYISDITETSTNCPASCTCLLYRDECNYSGYIVSIDNIQRYVLHNETSVIVCNQVRASMTCDDGSEGEQQSNDEYFGTTYVFTIEEKIGGIAALFDVMDSADDKICEFCMDKDDNNTLISLDNSNMEECEVGYGWLRVPNASNLEEVDCPSIPNGVITIEPIIPTKSISSTIIGISGGFDSIGSTLSSALDIDSTAPKQEEEGISAIKVGYRLQLQYENFDELYVGADGYIQYNEECINECCSIKYKDSCNFDGASPEMMKLYSRDSMHITALLNDTTVIMCSKTMTWDACSNTDDFKYLGSTKYYELIQEDDSVSVLSGVVSDDATTPACNDVCLNNDGDLVVTYDNTDVRSSCVLGSGWLKVKNYTLDTCSSILVQDYDDNNNTDSISTNQTEITAALLEQENATTTNDELNAIVEDVMTTSSSSYFPTFAPNTQNPNDVITDVNDQIPAAGSGYSADSVDGAAAQEDSISNSAVIPRSVNTNVIILLVFSVAISALLLL